jgi:hypothetical protein
MTKKTTPGKSKQNYRSEDESWDRPRHKVKAIRQNKDAQSIDRALKRKDYRALTEDFL